LPEAVAAGAASGAPPLLGFELADHGVGLVVHGREYIVRVLLREVEEGFCAPCAAMP
jgi:hypothetical protein